MAIDKNAVINEARKFAAKGLYDKAIAEWKKVLSETPHDANLFNTIGDLCIKKNARAEAVDAYKRAADILAEDGFTSKAIALYKKILNIDVNKVEVHLALGDMHAEKGLTGNALQNYKFAADYYKKENKTADALGIYQKMADLDPSNVAFRIKLADMYAKERMTAEAVTAYLAAADVHLSKDAIKEARHLFEKILAIDPDNKVVYYKAGIAYLKEGKFSEACKALKPAFEKDPDNRELSDTYIEALMKAGKAGDAEPVLLKVLAGDPGRTDLREKLYALFIATHQYDKAFETVAALARARIEQSDRDGAEEAFRQFIASAPDYAPARTALAELYASLDRGRDAADSYLEAAKIFSAEGDIESAKSALDKTLAVAPDLQEAKDLMDSLASAQAPGAKPEPETAEEAVPLSAAAPEVEPAETPAVEFLAEPEPAAEISAPPEIEEPAVEELPAAAPAEPVAEVRTAETEQVDPAVTEALLEADVLVKYGLTTKAIEQLEGLAKKFPGSLPLHVKLRDLHGDQGQMRSAAAHMLAMADLYLERGMRNEAEQVLRSALEIDPSNAEVSARLGLAPAPAAAGPAATPAEPVAPSYEDFGAAEDLSPKIAGPGPEPASPEPAPFSFDDFTPPEDMAETSSPPAPETAAPPRKDAFPAPAGEIALEGFDAGMPDTEAEPPAAEEALAPEAETGPTTGEEPPAGAFDGLTGAPATTPDIYGTFPPPDEEPGALPVGEEPTGAMDQEPAAPEEPLEGESEAGSDDVNELWAEAEFYFQQGLFSEAKKHYARIIQLDPGDSNAIERLAELSREEEDTEEFTRLAEAVEGLESAPLPEGHSEDELPLSDTDEEAVRSLMQEITQIRQAPRKPAAPKAKDAFVPPAHAEALPEKPSSPQPPPKAPETASSVEDYFDLGAELAAESRASAPAKQEKENGDFFDLASELRDELSVETPARGNASAEEESLDDIFEEFKQGVENQSAREDMDTHYNLGVAYREMGLLDDAIAEFIMTPESEPKFIQSRYMLGLCYMEKGEYQEAISEIQSAVNGSKTAGADASNLTGMLYDLGLAYQGAGNISGALREFQTVQGMDANYRDIAEKIRELSQGDYISLDQLKDDIEKEISSKFLEEGQRIEREEKNRRNERVRS